MYLYIKWLKYIFLRKLYKFTGNNTTVKKFTLKELTLKEPKARESRARESTATVKSEGANNKKDQIKTKIIISPKTYCTTKTNAYTKIIETLT